MQKVKINNRWFYIQSYMDGEFANLVDTTGEISCVRVDYINKNFTSFGKQDKKWKSYVAENKEQLLNSNDTIFAIFFYQELGKDFYLEMKESANWLREQIERVKKGQVVVTQRTLFSGV